MLVLISLLVFTGVDFKYSLHPYIWEFFLSGICFMYFAFNTQRSVAKILWWNLAILLFCFGLLEVGTTVLPIKQVTPDRFEGEYSSKKYFTSDEILGYAPKKNVRVTSRKYLYNKLLYDVIYTINKQGLRITPSCEGLGCKDAVLFFGDSFTFGEGLNDDQTVPYLVGKLSKVKVYNFGFHGYGPHQMLSEIEHGLVKKAVDGKPKCAIFQTAPWHVERAAGYSWWDQHGPRYILSQDGKIKYAGHFDDSPTMRVIKELLDKSAIYRNFFKGRYHVNNGDVERYIAIVAMAQSELMKKYPGLEFHVIYWDYGSVEDKAILDGFQKEGIKVHHIRDILPNFDNRSDYKIPDGHPTFIANRYIANYIVQNILKGT